MRSVDVAIVGAGPNGLSLAAHLRARGVDYVQFGIPMWLWRSAMPQGMFLKSEGSASSLSDPAGTHTLEAFCAATGRDYADCGLPVSLDTFVNYGQWFRSDLGLEVEETLVDNLAQRDAGFELTLGTGERLVARRVVIAVGVEHFTHIPEPLSALPAELCTHSSRHSDPATFRDREVVIVGAGQSALELAALMHESGVAVKILVRKEKVAWNGKQLCSPRPLLSYLRTPQSGLGYGWKIWAYANLPGVFRRLPEATRIAKARTALGPAGAPWLRDRVDGKVPILTGCTVTDVKDVAGRVHLTTTSADGTNAELEADHVVAATGYRPDLDRLTFLSDGIRSGLKRVGDSPAVGPDFQSSIGGLYFIGPAVAPTFGPLTRFVYGSPHAAPTVARRLAGGSVKGARPIPAVSQ
jgi:cation diffusion facilitator CzcD-associated flavoprotein CzcO